MMPRGGRGASGGHQEREVTGHQRDVVPRNKASPRSLNIPDVLLHCNKAAVMLSLLGFGEQGNWWKSAADVELICVRLLARCSEPRISKRRLDTGIGPFGHPLQWHATRPWPMRNVLDAMLVPREDKQHNPVLHQRKQQRLHDALNTNVGSSGGAAGAQRGRSGGAAEVQRRRSGGAAEAQRRLQQAAGAQRGRSGGAAAPAVQQRRCSGGDANGSHTLTARI